jgi:hypothetical protein
LLEKALTKRLKINIVNGKVAVQIIEEEIGSNELCDKIYYSCNNNFGHDLCGLFYFWKIFAPVISEPTRQPMALAMPTHF